MRWFFMSGTAVSDSDRDMSDDVSETHDLLRFSFLGNVCERTPLWGSRFHCRECKDIDLCEECYDFRRRSKKFLQSAPRHMDIHEWTVVEVAVPAIHIILSFFISLPHLP
jgi:hypothetical protein